MLQFVDEPPKPTRGPAPGTETCDWRTEATELRKHPDKWALLSTRKNRASAALMAAQVRAGRLMAFRTGRWEAVSRDCDVYARYLGETS